MRICRNSLWLEIVLYVEGHFCMWKVSVTHQLVLKRNIVSCYMGEKW